jgi:hypothetical protein
MSNARKALLGTAAFLGVVYLVWLTLKVMDSLPSGPLQSNLFGFGLFSVAVVLALPILAARSDRYLRWKRARSKQSPRSAEFGGVAHAAANGSSRVYAPAARGFGADAVALGPADDHRYELAPVSPPSSMTSSAVDSFAEMTPAPVNDYTPPPVSAHGPEPVEDPFAVYRESQETGAMAPISTGSTPPPASGRTGSFGRVRAPFLERPPANSALIGLAPQALSARPSPPAVSQRAAPLRRGTRLPAPAAPRSGDALVPVVAPQQDPSSNLVFQTQDGSGGTETPIGHPPLERAASFAMMNVDEHGADHIEQALESLEREIITTGSLSPLGPSARTQLMAPVPMDLAMPAFREHAEPGPPAVAQGIAAPALVPSPAPVHNPLEQTENEPSSLEDVFMKAVDSATRDLTKAAAVARLRALKTKLVPTVPAEDSTRQVPLEDVLTQMQAMRTADPDVPESIEDALGSTRIQQAPTLEGLLALSVDLGLSEDEEAPSEPQAPAAPVVADRRSFTPDPFRTGVGSLDKDALNTLWRDFALASEECGRNPAMLRNEVFRDHVVRNHDAICRRFGVARVAFSVKIKDGRPTLSAKPLASQTAQTA